MPLVESLLTAIVRADGDALVMHVGEKPYVVASTGPIELSTKGLNLEAMAGMLAQLLPGEVQGALIEFGAVEHELASTPAMKGDRFTVVAARGGDDVWIEIRRHRRPRAAGVAADSAANRSTAGTSHTSGGVTVASAADETAATARSVPPATANAVTVSAAAVATSAAPVGLLAAPVAPLKSASPPANESVDRQVAVGKPPTPTPELPAPEATAAPEPARDSDDVATSAPTAPTATPVSPPSSASTGSGDPPATPSSTSAPPSSMAEAIPMTRTVRIDVPSQRGPSVPPRIERLLGSAVSRGASALYLTSQARPFVRVDDDVRVLEDEATLSSTDVESAVLELMPDATREALRRGEPIEWVAEFAEVGRVQCSTFRDYRGPGAIFQLISVRPLSAEQLELSPEMQALCTEAEGLVLVASPRGAGKSTLVGAFIDLINRQRADYVISLERQIRLVHDNRNALISQREVRGTAEQVLAVARSAIREQPHVLVIDDLVSADMCQLALEAAGSGILVFATVTASSTTAALSAVLELFPPERRKAVQALLGERLRGAIAQLLLRKTAGGRAAARELMLTTGEVANLVTEGQLSDLPLIIERGREHGMVTLTDSLVGFIRERVIDGREAYRKADDRDALVRALKNENIDTSGLERLV